MAINPFNLIEQAEAAMDEAEKSAALGAAIQKLSENYNRNVDDFYALGYAWYLMPNQTRERDREINRNLSYALKLEPEHRYARLYLAHHYFDKGKWEEALKILNQFDVEEFAKLDQSWRDVKVAELILCCYLERRDRSCIREALINLLERASAVDTTDIPTPDELVKSLMNLVI